MPKTKYEKGEVRSSLLKKGFRSQNGSNHEKFFFYHNGKKTGIMTVLPYGSNKDGIGAPLFSRIRKEMKFFEKSSLEKFVECTLTQEDYLTFLLKNKFIQA